MMTNALTRADVTARLVKAQDEIFRLGVRRLALFGSVQRNAAKPDSDVDLLVEFESGQKTFDHFLDLGELLEQVLGQPVDLVTTEALSPFLGPHILADATDVLRAA
jgi:predicted nucleotidyltransferase